MAFMLGVVVTAKLNMIVENLIECFFNKITLFIYELLKVYWKNNLLSIL